MRNLDDMINEALVTEERELLRDIGEEPGFFAQASGVFGGTTGWVHALLMVVQTVLFLVGIWAAWHFFQADDPLAAIRWGLPSASLLLMALIIKLSLWPVMQTNRILREIKRLELRIAHRTRE